MKLKYNFDIMEIADELVAVPVGEDNEKFKGVIQLNQSGAIILQLIKDETTVDQILDELSTKFPNIGKKVLKDDLEEFLSALKEKGILN